jgi:hypothetical protein
MNRSAHAAECGQISTYNEKRDVWYKINPLKWLSFWRF